jgi:hypothetical protein
VCFYHRPHRRRQQQQLLLLLPAMSHFVFCHFAIVLQYSSEPLNFFEKRAEPHDAAQQKKYDERERESTTCTHISICTDEAKTSVQCHLIVTSNYVQHEKMPPKAARPPKKGSKKDLEAREKKVCAFLLSCFY